MLKVIQGGLVDRQVDCRGKVLHSFAMKLKQRQLASVEPSGPCCPWPCPFPLLDPMAA